MKYHIYHIAGVKYGCTNNLERRRKEMLKRYGKEIEHVESFDCIAKASAREIELNKQYATKDRKPYSDMIKMRESVVYLTGEQHHNFGQDISGSKNPNFGNKWTDEQKKRLSKMNTNPKESTRKKMREAWRNRDKVKCPHCGKESVNRGNMNRWHFDNCKSGPQRLSPRGEYNQAVGSGASPEKD